MVRLAAILLLAAGAAHAQGTARTFTIVATPGRLTIPASVAAGPVTFVLQNRTDAVVSAQLMAVRDDHTPEQAVAQLTSGAPRAEWILPSGGVGPLVQGGSASVTHVLRPGGYVLLSTVKDADGVAQSGRGSIAPFRVTGTPWTDPTAAVTGVTASIAVGAGTFRLRRVAERDGRLIEWVGRPRGLALPRGDLIIEVETAGGSAHEIAMVRMDPDVSLRQYTRWLDGGQRGTAPGRPLGGAGVLPGGSKVWLHARLERGTYWFYCNSVHRGGRRGWETGEYAQTAVR